MKGGERGCEGEMPRGVERGGERVVGERRKDI